MTGTAHRLPSREADFVLGISDGLRQSAADIDKAIHELMATELNADQRAQVDIARERAETLLKTVNDLYDLSTINAGGRFLSNAFDLRLVAEDAVQLPEPAAQVKGLDLILRYSPRLPRRAIGDAGRVRQILTSLVGDCVTRVDRGSVWLDLEYAASTGTTFEVRIRLEGTHTKPSVSRTKSNPGLAIALRLVDLMGGRVLTSGPPLWVFSIPLGCDPDEWPDRRPPSSIAGHRVLVIDRSAKLRAVLRERLESWGLMVLDASGGEDGLKAICAATEGYWAIFISTEMAGIDWEAFSRAAQTSEVWHRAGRFLLAPRTKLPEPAAVQAAGFRSALARNPSHAALVDALSQLAGAPDTASRREPRSSGTPGSRPPTFSFNLDDVLDRCGGDRALLSELVEGFEQSSGELVKKLIQAVAHEDSGAAIACAQNIRARADLLSASDLSAAVDRLEQVVEIKHWSAAPAAVSAAKLELLRLATELPFALASKERP